MRLEVVRDPPLDATVLRSIAAELRAAERVAGPSGVRARALESEVRAVRTEGGTVLALRAEGRWAGLAAIRRLAWDSNHFGMESFRVGFFGHWNAGERGARELAKVVVHVVRESGAHFVRAWAPLDDIAGIRALEDAGFRIADVLTSFGADPSGMDWSAEPAGDVHVRQAKAGDEAVLAAIARDTFTRAPDRFHADPAIPAVLANDLYAEWIANSVRGRAADRVFVGCLGVDVVGFTTVLVDREPIVDGCGRTAGMPLVGVAREAQGHGCARGLIRAAIAWMAGEGIGFAHIGTQANNLPMQRVLPRIGLRLFQVGPSLHLWLSGQ